MTFTKEQLIEHITGRKEFAEECVSDSTLHPERREYYALSLATLEIALAALESRADAEPVAWTDADELRDATVSGSAYLFGIGHDANKFADPRRQIMLYTRAQPAPVVVDFNKLARELVENLVDCNGADDSAVKQYQKWAEKTCRAAMLNGGKS